jgi:hypothetical protein
VTEASSVLVVLFPAFSPQPAITGEETKKILYENFNKCLQTDHQALCAREKCTTCLLHGFA